jgi:hypothetical protein
MEKRKRQKFKEGAVVKIVLSHNRIVFGRLLPSFQIGIYDCIYNKDFETSSIMEVYNLKTLFYCTFFKNIITNGLFEIVGFRELTSNELNSIPPSYNQDKVNINDCVIFYYDGRERKATPQECIGLEKSSVWEAASLVERIEDLYAGKKNKYAELFKVILSKDDPRYLPPPNALRWNFEKQEFYRVVQ